MSRGDPGPGGVPGTVRGRPLFLFASDVRDLMHGGTPIVVIELSRDLGLLWMDGARIVYHDLCSCTFDCCVLLD